MHPCAHKDVRGVNTDFRSNAKDSETFINCLGMYKIYIFSNIYVPVSYFSVWILFKLNHSFIFSVLNVTPKLHIFKELQQRLQETNDVPGALCCIRQAFMDIKMNKK